MTGINSYSTTASENVQANTGVNWDEGMAPGQVNNSARQNMADLRTAFDDLIWFQYGIGSKTVAPVYASATSFTLVGADVTATWHAGRRVKAVGSSTGTIYGSISSTSFAASNTTVTVAWDSGALANEALTIYLSQVPVTGSPVHVSGLTGLSPITSSLSADVNLNNVSNYFDGPSLAQGTRGTWFVSGTVSMRDTAGAAGFSAKLWDGTTLIASAIVTSSGAGANVSISLSGLILNPAGNLRISVRDLSSTSGVIEAANVANNNSTITAFRIV